MASGPITSQQTEGENVEAVTDFLLSGSKITLHGDRSHEIRRCLLLGRKAMRNLDSVLKSRDAALLTKARTVQAVVFPLVTHSCESWTVKNAEHQRIDPFKLWCWRRLLNPLDSKEINPEYLLEGLTLKLKLQYFGHLMQTADSLEKSLMLGKIEGRRRRERQRMR